MVLKYFFILASFAIPDTLALTYRVITINTKIPIIETISNSLSVIFKCLFTQTPAMIILMRACDCLPWMFLQTHFLSQEVFA